MYSDCDICYYIDILHESLPDDLDHYTRSKLKTPGSLEIISEIITHSGKKPDQAVLVFLSAIRYLLNDPDGMTKLKKEDSFTGFINNYREKLIKIGTTKKVQANIPERALPVLEVMGRYIDRKRLAVIELGSSFGLLGYTMLHYHRFIENKKRYFKPGQKLPIKVKLPNMYIGLDLDPPDKKWLLSCSDKKDAKPVQCILDEIPPGNNFSIIKSNAFHFPSLQIIKEIINKEYTPLFLTSFMLYQFSEEKKQELIELIEPFIEKNSGFWINQCVTLLPGEEKVHFYTEFNRKRILELSDDRGTNWEIVNA